MLYNKNKILLTTPLRYHKAQAELAKTIFTERVTVCHPDSQAHLTPFFVPDLNNNTDIIEQLLASEIDTDYLTKLNIFWEKIGLSRLLYYLYLAVRKPNTEFSLNNYTFFSLNDLEKRYQIFCDSGQTRVCDLAHTYLGLGHIKVLSFDIASKQIYARHDGGSNGWDRDEHWKFSKTLDPSCYQEDLYQLDSFLKGVIDDDKIKMIN